MGYQSDGGPIVLALQILGDRQLHELLQIVLQRGIPLNLLMLPFHYSAVIHRPSPFQLSSLIIELY